MAIRFNIDKFQVIKQAYIEYITSGRCSTDMLQNFAAYKPYFDADKELQNTIRDIRSLKDAERKQAEKLQREILRHAEEINQKKEKIRILAEKQRQEDLKKNKENKQVNIKKKLNEICQKLGVSSKKSQTITQTTINESLYYLDSIPSEFQEILKDQIGALRDLIKQRQAALNVNEYINQLAQLEKIEDDGLFNEKFNNLKQLVTSTELTEKERGILMPQLSNTVNKRAKYLYAKHFQEFSKNISLWLNKIENNNEKTHTKLLELNDVDKEIRSGGFKKPEILNLQRSVSKVRKRLTEFEQENKNQQSVIAVPWNDIDFGIDIIRIFSKGKIVYYKLTSCKKSFNQIKKSLSDKLPPIVLVKDQGKWVLKDPKVLKDALNIIKQNESGNIVANTRILQQEIIVSWDDVNFGNNIINIFSKGKLVYSKSTSCRKSYNQIKEYLSDKLPKIVLVKNASDIWTLKEPIVLQNALMMIRRQESENLLLEEQYRTAQRSYSSIENYLKDKINQELVLRRLKEKKQDFLNYLIKHQLLDYKLVPAIEMLAYESAENIDEEDVFVFTVQCKSYRYGIKDYVNIIYENVNPARATIVCTVEKQYYKLALQSIYNFMNNAKEKNKRSRLRQILKLNNYVKNLHLVNHTDMHTWATTISM